MNAAAPTHLYVGRREVVLAEIGEHRSIYPGRWLVTPIDSVGAGDFDSEGVNTKRDAQRLVRELRRHYPNIEVIWL